MVPKSAVVRALVRGDSGQRPAALSTKSTSARTLAGGKLRAGWFMDNAAWDVASAREGVIESYLAPLDRPLPMVATRDIACTLAQLLRESWRGRRVVELGRPTSPNDIAAGFARALERPVQARAVPRERWEARFQAEGTAWPAPRLEMLDGFNSGCIWFEGEARLSPTTFEQVARSLV